MDDLTPVKGPPTPFEGRSAKVLGLVLIALLVAIVKPWGSGSEAVTPTLVPASASATPAAPVAVATSATPDPWANYDHEIFGIYEPEPRWELWPAGYLVSFGYAFRIESTPAGQSPSGVASPAPGSSAAPTASTLPGASGKPPDSVPSATVPPPQASPTAVPPVASGAPADDGPTWPATIRITDGNHLGLIGINMPLGFRVSGMGVFRTTDGADEPLDIISPASDWPSHFTIVAIADESRSEAIERWPPGTYRLELTFEPGNISRSIVIEIDPSRFDEPERTASPGPS
jgi:hypothetical protein